MLKSTIKLAILTLLLTTPSQLFADSDDNEHSDYRLFHVERSKNKNIVCYDVNLSDAGLNTIEPIKVYWINREERVGARDGLSAIQKRLAFGYRIKSKNGASAQIAINACPNRAIRVEKDTDSSYRCFTQINHQDAVLSKIYVKTKESNSLSVEYVELSGISITSGKLISERIYN